jgi:hypothetical protein
MIDLKATYGDVYQIGEDQSATIPGQTNEDRAWLQQIPCVHGHISIHGENTLGVWTGGVKIIRRLQTIEGVRLRQRGDREASFTFDPSLFAQVAEIIQPRKKRHTPPERAESVRSWRFQKGGETPPI